MNCEEVKEIIEVDSSALSSDLLNHLKHCPSCARLSTQEKTLQQLLSLAASIELQPPDSLWVNIKGSIEKPQIRSRWSGFIQECTRLFDLPDLRPAGIALVLALILSGGLTSIRSGMNNPLLVELRNYELMVPENPFFQVPDTENPFLPKSTGNPNPTDNGKEKLR